MFRLQIVSTGKFFVMGTSSLALDLQSSLFNNQDDIIGSRTFDGEMPLEPNRALINNSHYINTENTGRTLQARMWFGYTPFKQAKMVFRIEGQTIKYDLLIDFGVVNATIKNLKLYQVLDPAQDGQLNFPNNAQYLAYMMSTTTAAPGSMPMVFFPYKNDGAYNDIAADQQATFPDIKFPVDKYINAWQVNGNDGTFLLDAPGGKNKETQTPFFYVTYVITRIIKYLGLTPKGSWLKDPDANRVVIFSNVSIFSNIIADFTYYMPDILVSDFLKEMRTELGLLIDPNITDGTCQVENISNLLSSGPVVDLRGRQLANTFSETGLSASGYLVSQGAEDKDQAFNDTERADLSKLEIGDVSGDVEIQDIQLSGVATKMLIEQNPHSYNWRLPYIKMPVFPKTPFDQISPLKTSDHHNFKLRLLYYHGMVEDAGGYLYPYGSSDNLGLTNNQLTKFTLSLSLTGTAYSNLQKFYTFITQSKPFEMGFLLTLKEFLELAPNNRLLVKDFDFSTVVCIYDVVSADLDDQSIDYIKVKMTLYPDVRPVNKGQITPDDTPVLPVDPPVDNGPVFAKMTLSNYTNIQREHPTQSREDFADLKIFFYADAAGTIPKLVTGLAVSIHQKITHNAATVSDGSFTKVCDGSVYVVAPSTTINVSQGGDSYGYSYSLNPGAHYTVIN